MKTIIKFIYIAFAASLALTACSPDDDHSLGTYDISADQISFELTPGSDEWTYNYAVTIGDDVSTIYSCQVNFGDGVTTKNLTGSHVYMVEEGTYTAQCIIYTPDGNMIVKDVAITINNDYPVSSVWVDVNSADNLWYGVSFTPSFWYAPDWSQISDPTLTIDGTEYTLSFPTATTDQWQNQFTLITDNLTTTASENYDFRVTMNSSNNITGVTVKLAQNDNDNTFIFTERIDLVAGEDVDLELFDLAGVDITKAKLVFDFGGNPANTTVSIKDIILQEHQ